MCGEPGLLLLLLWGFARWKLARKRHERELVSGVESMALSVLVVCLR